MSEEKYRFTVRLSREANRLMKSSMERANCQSQNEFAEKAIRFYAGYLTANDATEFLAPIITQAIRGTMDSFCAHISRNLFRLAVEDAKVWNILAAAVNIPPEKLPAIHGKALSEVKRLKGQLTIEHIVADPPVIETADTEEEDE
jgi:hypothetical protein